MEAMFSSIWCMLQKIWKLMIKASCTGKPQNNDIGKHTVIISVSDGDLKLRRHFDIDVKEKL